MVATRAAFTLQKWVCKLATRPRLSAVLENIHGKTLDVKKQLTEIIFQANLLADKSTNLPNALISKQNCNEMQGTIDKCLAKLLSEQECNKSAMHQLEIQLGNTRVGVTTQHHYIIDLEEALQTSE